MASESTSTGSAAPQPEPLSPERHPNIDHIVTEDNTPLDNVFSEKQQRLLTEPLYSSWAGPDNRRRFVALANVGLFFAIREPPYVPDMLLSLDVELPQELWPKRNRSYFVWEYGKPPEVVIEIVSNREGDEDKGKLDGYARVGVKYYVIFDPGKILGQHVLRGFQLEAMCYRAMDEPIWLPGVELGLRIWQGEYEGRDERWLRWFDSAGEPIATGAERAERERTRADQERARADQERARADQERARADQERARGDRLAEQLRQLGHEPQE